MDTDADIVQQPTIESEDGDLDAVILPSKLKKQRNLALLDSDDESFQESKDKLCDQNSNRSTLSPSYEQESNDFSESGQKKSKGKLRRSRIKPVWISEDSDNSNSGDHSSHLSKEDNTLNLSNQVENNLSNDSSQEKFPTKNLNCDSDDDSANDQDNIKKKSTKLSSGWFSWEDGDDSDGSCKGDGSSKKLKISTNSASTNKRNLKKKSNEGMQEIQRQSQRMVRESSVCLPYHKPKQRSLMEFLNRKRASRDGTIKPSHRDVGSTVQVLEDSVKEIEEFFKSESEESENEIGESAETLLPSTETPLPSTEISLPSTEIALSSTESPFPSTEIPLPSTEIPLPSIESALPSTDHEIQTKSSTEFVADGPAELDNKTETVSFSEEIMPSYKEKVENLKRLSISKISKPTLHGRPGQVLDFDLDVASMSEQKANVNNLIERFVQQVTSTKKSPQKRDHQISVVHKVINADGQLELKRDVLNVPVENNSSERAGAGRRQFLKDSLRQSITAKRAVDRIKKIENQQIENEELPSDDKIDSEPEEEILSDLSDTDSEEEENSDCGHIEKGKKKKNMFVEEEAEDSDQDGSSDYETNQEVESKSAVKTSNQSDERNNGFKTPLDFEVEARKLDSLLDDSVSAPRSDMKLNLKALGCSSSFEDLTPNLDMSDSSEEDIIPKLKCTQTNETSNVEELLALCSGKFPDSLSVRDSQISSFTENADDESDEEAKPFSRIIPMVDDDEDDEDNANLKLFSENNVDEPGTVPSFLDDEKKSMSKMKKRARICLSDDEDDDEDTSVVEDEEMHEEEREFRGLTEFFDNEAELSGSEVGSGDEREDGADDWEEEEGDKEDIDENEVREQVGRAHMKTMLDQDQREVRLFQELFLEDGDLHSEGDGRQRQFRWKQAGDETEGDDTRPKSQEDEGDETAEDHDDVTWRKLRSDREKWLQQQKSQQETNKDVPLVMKRKGKIVKINTTIKTIANAIAEGDPSTATSTIKQPTNSKANIISTVKRGSFLRRSEKDLSELASLTKSVLPVQAPKNGSNFVFASITPERPVAEQSRKHKQDSSKCDSSKQNPAPAKKAKISSSAKSIFSYF